MSNWLIKILLFEYMVVMIVCVFEKNWMRTMYWFGATLLQASILYGMK